jgi:hypothetical protein
MVSIRQIREVVAGYLSHRDLERFVREFSPLSFNIRQQGDADAIALAKGIEATLAELHVGHLNKDSVRARLAGVLTPSGSIVEPSYGAFSATTSNGVASTVHPEQLIAVA